MTELNMVQQPILSPTQCFFCRTHEGPMLDCNIEMFPYGHVYICAPNDRRNGCVAQMALKCGFDSIGKLDWWKKKAAGLEEQVAALQGPHTFTITNATIPVTTASAAWNVIENINGETDGMEE